MTLLSAWCEELLIAATLVALPPRISDSDLRESGDI
jgi:hypothetical protein